eukprot:2442031-Pleurochrysis_carterae.AAC.3
MHSDEPWRVGCCPSLLLVLGRRRHTYSRFTAHLGERTPSELINVVLCIFTIDALSQLRLSATACAGCRRLQRVADRLYIRRFLSFSNLYATSAIMLGSFIHERYNQTKVKIFMLLSRKFNVHTARLRILSGNAAKVKPYKTNLLCEKPVAHQAGCAVRMCPSSDVAASASSYLPFILETDYSFAEH